jgi:hypothetical protein
MPDDIAEKSRALVDLISETASRLSEQEQVSQASQRAATKLRKPYERAIAERSGPEADAFRQEIGEGVAGINPIVNVLSVGKQALAGDYAPALGTAAGGTAGAFLRPLLSKLGPKVIQAVREHPKEVAAFLASVGLIGGANEAGTAEQEETWKTLGITQKEWRGMTDEQRDKARDRAATIKKSREIPDSETLQKLGLTADAWRQLPEEKRGELLSSLSSESKEAAKSLRERNPWVNALPYATSAFFGTQPLASRFGNRLSANKFIKEQLKNLDKGEKAVEAGQHHTAEQMVRALEGANKQATSLPARPATWRDWYMGRDRPAGSEALKNPLWQEKPKPHLAAPFTAGLEAAWGPEQVDYINSLRHGTPEEQQRAYDRLVNVGEGLTGAQSMLTAVTGHEFGRNTPIPWPKRQYPMNTTKAFVDTYKPIFKSNDALQAAIQSGKIPPSQFLQRQQELDAQRALAGGRKQGKPGAKKATGGDQPKPVMSFSELLKRIGATPEE